MSKVFNELAFGWNQLISCDKTHKVKISDSKQYVKKEIIAKEENSTLWIGLISPKKVDWNQAVLKLTLVWR